MRHVIGRQSNRRRAYYSINNPADIMMCHVFNVLCSGELRNVSCSGELQCIMQWGAVKHIISWCFMSLRSPPKNDTL